MISSAREKVQQIWERLTSNSMHWRSFFISFAKGLIIGLILLVMGGYGTFRLIYWNKIFPRVYLLQQDVSGKLPDYAVYLAKEELHDYLSKYSTLSLLHKNSKWSLPLDSLDLWVNESQLQSDLISIGRSGSIMDQLSDQWDLLTSYKEVSLPLEYHNILIQDFISTASTQIENPLIPPMIYKGNSYNPKTESLVYVERGQAGEKAYIDETFDEIDSIFSNLSSPTQELITKEDAYIFTEEEVSSAVLRAKSLLSKNLVLAYENPKTNQSETWTLSDSDLLSFLSLIDQVDHDAILTYAKSAMKTINSPAEDAVFRYNDSLSKVEAFKPGVNGVEVQADTLAIMISEAIEDLISGANESPISIPITHKSPNITTSSVNDLGINDLIGRGESTYYHSSTSRKHNVEYAAALLDGVLVPPGEVFSFNGVVGEISIATGFKQAMIIKDGETILGDGGGVCQDSTTLFRAILNAGLPISGWRNHSFRVGYYEQNSKPGFDATIFSPLPDLKFTNNTPGHILIQTTAKDMKLTYELYGTDDGRIATISNYTQWDAAPPPPDLYKDDPTLSVGVVKKVESAVPGLKTKFDYSVTRDEEIIFEKTFISVYRPWQAVYLRGTKAI